MIGYITLTLCLGLPLLLAGILLIAAFRLRRRKIRLISGVLGALLLTVVTATSISIAPYLWAIHLEAQWTAANPKTKIELESHLSLYSQRSINPSQSAWGRNYQLQPGERMTQYLLLWNAPLDVVYSPDDKIIQIYTSYE
jgi:hypothetical protein